MYTCYKLPIYKLQMYKLQINNSFSRKIKKNEKTQKNKLRILLINKKKINKKFPHKLRNFAKNICEK